MTAVPAEHDVAIVFPPLWYYPYPPHELASIAALTRASGYRALVIDANREGLAACLTDAFLSMCAERVATGATVRAGEALRTLRDPTRCLDLPAHVAARRALDECWRLVSGAHGPTEVDFIRLRFAGEVEDPEIAAEVASGPMNPFLNYIRASLVPSIVASGARVAILLYVHTDQSVPLLSIAMELRRAGWNGTVVVGGSLEDQISFGSLLRVDRAPGYARLATWMDHVVAFELEPALPALLDRLFRGASLDGVPNVMSFRGERLVRPARIAVADPDGLPPIDLDDIPLELYPFPTPTISMLGSRGCYWDRCTFCAIARNQVRYAARAPETVAADISRLVHRNGVRWVVLRDQLVSPAWLRRFSEAILALGVDIRWSCRMRFERAVDRELLRCAVEAGCRQVWLGLESASERVLTAMDKGIALTDVERILRACDDVGLGVHLLCLHGFPGETDEEADATVRFVEERVALVDSVSFSQFVWFAGSPIYRERERRGLRPRADHDRLLQARFEWRTDEEIRLSHRRHLELHARLDRAVPMPLAHVAHVAHFVDRWGTRGWRSMRSETFP